MTYQQRPTITREQELELLAEIYRLALESYWKRKDGEGGLATAPDVRKEIDGSGKTIIPK